jgi:hypothetical protein
VTLKFIRDGRLAPVNRIDDIEVVDRDDNVVKSIKDQFRIVRGQLVATNPARLFEVLAPQLDEAIVVRAEATDAKDGIHTGKMTFRVAQWPLSVRLEAPPSNPGLSVANIEVGLSLAGGFAVQRVSGTNGRFEIESLPAGPIDFDCETVSDGAHYYCEAMLDHSGPASVTVVLRGVKDVVNGVRPLRIEFQDIVRRPSRR